MIAHDPQLLKGLLGMVLLALLEERESYGYELVGRIHDAGLPGVPDGSVYPALGRLEREHYVESRLVASSNGPARKYYRPTVSGLALLRERAASFRALADVVEPLLPPVRTSKEKAA
jgi:PadR family transcriptional regulator